MTLLKNDQNVLPFSKEKTKRIAVIGKLGNQGNIGDHGSSRVSPKYVVTPLEGIKNCSK
nr:glycoside hydrolase family 3 C-terminal domain-containing protein [Geobacillus sp. BMUD]